MQEWNMHECGICKYALAKCCANKVVSWRGSQMVICQKKKIWDVIPDPAMIQTISMIKNEQW